MLFLSKHSDHKSFLIGYNTSTNNGIDLHTDCNEFLKQTWIARVAAKLQRNTVDLVQQSRGQKTPAMIRPAGIAAKIEKEKKEGRRKKEDKDKEGGEKVLTRRDTSSGLCLSLLICSFSVSRIESGWLPTIDKRVAGWTTKICWHFVS